MHPCIETFASYKGNSYAHAIVGLINIIPLGERKIQLFVNKEIELISIVSRVGIFETLQCRIHALVNDVNNNQRVPWALCLWQCVSFCARGGGEQWISRDR